MGARGPAAHRAQEEGREGRAGAPLRGPEPGGQGRPDDRLVVELIEAGQPHGGRQGAEALGEALSRLTVAPHLPGEHPVHRAEVPPALAGPPRLIPAEGREL
ncbi:MAG: hypothetical protein ACK559_32740, partial [bacterium]